MNNSISFHNKDSDQAEVKNRAEQGNQSYDERDREVEKQPSKPGSSDHHKGGEKPDDPISDPIDVPPSGDPIDVPPSGDDGPDF